MAEHPSLLEQLRSMAGAGEGEHTFDVEREDVTVHVRHIGGSSASLVMHAAVPEAREETGAYRRAAGPIEAPRPMRIQLRLEAAADVASKESGRNREVQTGDAEFDRIAYVDSPSTDAVVLGVLGRQEARDAIVALLVDRCTIAIDDDEHRVTATIAGFAEKSPDPRRGERLVGAFARLVRNLPPIRAAAGAPPAYRWATLPRALGLAGGFVLFAGIPVYVAFTPGRCLSKDDEGTALVCSAGPECCGPAYTGGFYGLLAAVPLCVLWSRLVRGDSSASRRFGCAVVLTLPLCAMLGMLVARMVW
jgi:hypothetical protein